MKQRTVGRLWMIVMSALLAGCATPPPSPALPSRSKAPPVTLGTSFRCDSGGGFSVVFQDDAAYVTSASGRDVLLRDAGGLSPAQTVYSNNRFRAEFGLGAGGRDAVLQEHAPSAVRRCSQN